MSNGGIQMIVSNSGSSAKTPPRSAARSSGSGSGAAANEVGAAVKHAPPPNGTGKVVDKTA